MVSCINLGGFENETCKVNLLKSWCA